MIGIFNQQPVLCLDPNEVMLDFPVAGLSSTRNIQSCKCRVLRGPQCCVHVTGTKVVQAALGASDGSITHDVVADDYVLALPQASLFEAQDLNWCLCCWS